MNNLLKKLNKLAADSEPVSRARLAAAIVYKNKVIAFGTNQYKTHPMMQKFKKNDGAIFLHAEVDVINKAKKKLTPEKLSKASLIIVRVLQNGSFAMSKPCKGCSDCIEYHAVAKTYFTNDEGKLECM